MAAIFWWRDDLCVVQDADGTARPSIRDETIGGLASSTLGRANAIAPMTSVESRSLFVCAFSLQSN